MAQASSEAISSLPCHLSGITRICFSPDGGTIFTGGTDCLVRIHSVDHPDSEPGFHDNHTDEITSLTCSDLHLITACKDNIARIFSHPEAELQGFVTRSAGVPIRWVSVNKQGEKVAVCSDDLLVKIVDVHDTEKVSFLSDNPKSVRSAAWDPSGKYLVTAGCDGKLKIYDMAGTTPLNLKIMDGVIGPSESDADTSCYASWHPSGRYFAVPLRTNDIGIINREGWTKQPAFSQDGHNAPVSELAWSPNGRYLASAASTQILIWSTDSRTVVARHTNPDGSITGLAWSPISNLLAFTSSDGSFSRWAEPIPSDLPSPCASEIQEKKRVDRLLDDFDGDDVDMEDKGEEVDLDLDAEDGMGGEAEGDWIVDDEGDYGEEKKWGKGRQEVVNVTKAQPSFTPGSTAMKNKKRYLAFSMIGAVDVSDQDTHHVVNVEFHDKSARRGYHFQDHSKYSMASMGEQGIAFASSSSSSEQPSEIHYRPYDSWASSSDWTQSLPADEDATCIATAGPPEGYGLGHIIVSTTKGLVRFFTASGVQRYLWRLGEDVVCLAGGKEAVVVVHREGGTSLDGCQNLRYTIMDLDTFDILQDGRIPLPRKTTITWLGWTSDGAPAMFDSNGVLSMLDRYRRPGQARWVPILDTNSLRKEGRVERYWPVGVTSTHMSCAILKGSDREPWFPRPLLQEVELRMPLLNLDSQAGKLEESVMRGHLLLSLLTDHLSRQSDSESANKRIMMDKELLQLVQTACKADNLSRAYDISRLMFNAGTVESAAKIAGFYHLAGLEERIFGLKGEARVKEKKAERLGKEREKERERRFGPDYTSSNGSNGIKRERAGTESFAPRNTTRRSFGGVNRAETPQSTNGSTGKETYIPETPTGEDGPEDLDEIRDREVSPTGEKRKRGEEMDGGFAPRKRNEEFAVPQEPKKNPFAKKAAPASNPFAKTATAKPLDSVKSTSFFDRVDNIEMSGAPKTKPKSGKPASSTKPSTSGPGKQMTLMGLKKPPPPAPPISKPAVSPIQPIAGGPVHADSMVSTDTEDTQIDREALLDGEEEEGRVLIDETVAPGRILSESMVQETMSPEPEETYEETFL